MELDQEQTSHPGKSSKTRLSAKNERQALPVCTENLIRVNDVMESPKLAE